MGLENVVTLIQQKEFEQVKKLILEAEANFEADNDLPRWYQGENIPDAIRAIIDQGEVEIMRFFIEKGVFDLAEGRDSKEFLSYAGKKGALKIIRLFFELANLETPVMYVTYQAHHNSALRGSIEGEQIECVDYLLGWEDSITHPSRAINAWEFHDGTTLWISCLEKLVDDSVTDTLEEKEEKTGNAEKRNQIIQCFVKHQRTLQAIGTHISSFLGGFKKDIIFLKSLTLLLGYLPPTEENLHYLDYHYSILQMPHSKINDIVVKKALIDINNKLFVILQILIMQRCFSKKVRQIREAVLNRVIESQEITKIQFLLENDYDIYGERLRQSAELIQHGLDSKNLSIVKLFAELATEQQIQNALEFHVLMKNSASQEDVEIIEYLLRDKKANPNGVFIGGKKLLHNAVNLFVAHRGLQNTLNSLPSLASIKVSSVDISTSKGGVIKSSGCYKVLSPTQFYGIINILVKYGADTKACIDQELSSYSKADNLSLESAAQNALEIFFDFTTAVDLADYHSNFNGCINLPEDKKAWRQPLIFSRLCLIGVSYQGLPLSPELVLAMKGVAPVRMFFSALNMTLPLVLQDLIQDYLIAPHEYRAIYTVADISGLKDLNRQKFLKTKWEEHQKTHALLKEDKPTLDALIKFAGFFSNASAAVTVTTGDSTCKSSSTSVNAL